MKESVFLPERRDYTSTWSIGFDTSAGGRWVHVWKRHMRVQLLLRHRADAPTS